jgi:hypothetical protein
MRTFALLLLLCLCAAAPPPAVLDTLAPDAEARWIPFELTPANQILFTLTIDGRPARAILDTGVSSSMVSRSFVDAARMPVRAGTLALAIGGAVTSGWVDLHDLAIGALHRRGGRVTTAVLPPAATGGVPVDMLIGSDVTGGYALDLDYDARRFRLLPSGRMPFTGTIAPLRIAGTWPSYVTALMVGTHRIARMVVDTGDGSAITLTRAAWAPLPEARRATSTTIAYGIGGAAVVDVAIVPTLGSDATVAHGIETRIEPASGYTAAIGMNGRIGSGFLARYRVLLDPTAGRMVSMPGRQAAVATPRSTSGLLLRVERDRLTVLHVMRGGPAEASGWRAGEQICQVDGAPAVSAPLRWPIDGAGRTMVLRLCDGVMRRLTLRDFY